ncbi:hypothetical protein F183_A30380 [Bryobacterales bacterium F-183]|nr:hypothetical protein F183_A30380 [Bryobacterales bacterium F-183]
MSGTAHVADNYRAKLDEFFSLVPKTAMTQRNMITGTEYYGEVGSGSPAIPRPSKKDGEEKLKTWKENISKGIVDNEKFTTLTGLTHTKLVENWKGGGIMTSCNAFVMKVGQHLGVKGLGGFNVEKTMIDMGKRHCWVTPASGDKPQYGDVFETRSVTPGAGYENLHVGISLYIEGEDWWTIEGGQGGAGTGYDRVARVKKKYNTKHLLGWIDMRLLASGMPAMPDWLQGTWMIYAGSKNYIYHFNRYGEVTQKAYQPGGSGAEVVPNLDTGVIQSMVGDTFKIRWNGEGGIETFTYDRWNSFPSLMERMNGSAADGTALKGVRL